jgi:hypothetical protein
MWRKRSKGKPRLREFHKRVNQGTDRGARKRRERAQRMLESGLSHVPDVAAQTQGASRP